MLPTGKFLSNIYVIVAISTMYLDTFSLPSFTSRSNPFYYIGSVQTLKSELIKSLNTLGVRHNVGKVSSSSCIVLNCSECLKIHKRKGFRIYATSQGSKTKVIKCWSVFMFLIFIYI